MPRSLLFSAIKDEAPFLPEWIAYHRAVGFDEVHIAVSASDIPTAELCEALERAGEITLYANPSDADDTMKSSAARVWNAANPWNDGDWVLWLDTDEFLNIHAGEGQLQNLLDTLDGDDGLFVQHRIMGSSGCVGLPDRQLAHDMVGASKPTDKINLGSKTLWRASDKFTGFAKTAARRPLVNKGYAADVSMRLANGDLFQRDIGVNRVWLNGEDSGLSRRATRFAVPPKLAQINHYAVRSEALFKRKENAKEGLKRSDIANMFRDLDRNSHVDDSILRHLEATNQQLDHLHSDKDVSRIHTDAVAKIRSDLSAKDTAPETPELTLPLDEALLMREELTKARVYLEYGGGGSTLLAADMGVAQIWCVESDPKWAQMLRAVVKREVPDHDAVHVHTSYIGPTRAWALPKDDSAWRHYVRYPMSVWGLPGFTHPDVVLIDGRFRAGCFLACYLKHERPMRVLFDDYKHRSSYHRVEALVPLADMVGRMGVFDFDPAQKDLSRGVEMLELFNDVF